MERCPNLPENAINASEGIGEEMDSPSPLHQFFLLKP